MSEEILKALMRLFAIICKQDDGISEAEQEYVRMFLKQIGEEQVAEYYSLFEEYTQEKPKRKSKKEGQKREKLTSMTDSVRILGICKKINKTLTQKQKFIVLVRLFELVNSERNFSDQRMEILDTVAKVFKIKGEYYKLVESFVVGEDLSKLNMEQVLLVSAEEEKEGELAKRITIAGFTGHMAILKLQEVNLYFLRYQGKSDINLNNLVLNTKRTYLFANGSTIKPPIGKPIYYSDIIARFMEDESGVRLSFNVEKIQYTFPKGNIGLQDVSLSESEGNLVAIMGASGAGKTTLLSVLSGQETPSKGTVKINGIDLHKENSKIEGVIGYVPQDDLLIEELTVFQNLYYSAKLCFKDLTEEELVALVTKVIGNLGLSETRDLRVGNVMDKTISGGQRKRLNIGLELMREPSILFLDEPTSGLSSRDSENVMDLLRELTLKGKLIFVVIHQPSSDIYKMFDKVILLDTGGYQVYYGNPVEAITYFKGLDNQINSHVGECITCGNVNPETLFNIIEAKVVDEYGNLTDNRKVSPQKWNQFYTENFTVQIGEEIKVSPPKGLDIPGKFKQWKVFLTRDVLSKVSNKQYMLLNLLEAPLLAFFLSFVVRYTDTSSRTEYFFRFNENIPAYIFMCIIVALFIGLMVSAEEIFKDQRILKRETFLNLSRSSYLLSKIAILFTLSAIQAILFTIIGNSILEIKGMILDYWIVLFSVFCFANVTGLNISSAFNSAVTIYIIIPILIIPQMILGGAMFSYDKLNSFIGGGYKVPLVAEVMTSRWGYEALVVNQFVNNKYQKLLYNFEEKESKLDYQHTILIPELVTKVEWCMANYENKSDSTKSKLRSNLALLNYELGKQAKLNDSISVELDLLQEDKFNQSSGESLLASLSAIKDQYSEEFNKATSKKDAAVTFYMQDKNFKRQFLSIKNNYSNEYLSALVKRPLIKNKIVETGGKMVQLIDPIYRDPESGLAHFYSPYKLFFNKKIPTLYYNVIVIWIITLGLCISLYFDWLKKLLKAFGGK